MANTTLEQAKRGDVLRRELLQGGFCLRCVL
jgi:hypothetical protein